MLSRLSPRARIVLIGALALVTVLATTLAALQLLTPHASASPVGKPFCTTSPQLCTETHEPWNQDGVYTGHDEPSLLFYSNTAGSGNSNLYRLALPTQPATKPVQDASGGTWDFQLHPAFWFGMAMCDDQSGPNPGGTLASQTVYGIAQPNVPCTNDSDTNIFTSSSPADPHFIGRHPGVAFMEMQFYPPGWVSWPPGNSCDPTKWCAALNIDSFNDNQNTNVANNAACLNSVGIEPVNFAFITTSGVAHAPANPVDATLSTFTPNPSTDLFMNSGDALTVNMHDTGAGFQVVINDLTSGQSGSMTASVANDFGKVKFEPSSSTCNVDHSAFHPAYSTSSEATRVIWAAHSYNVAFSDEIGHFEYCSGVDPKTGVCHGSSVNDPSGLDGDENFCFSPSQSLLVRVGGCLGTEVDFDGVPYQPGSWPGNGNDANTPIPVSFSSPLANGITQFDRTAFETDLPRIEVPSLSPNNNCNRSTGAGCVNPPNGANFYPFYNANTSGGVCNWFEGGDGTPHNTFDGVSSAGEFGAVLTPAMKLTYPAHNASGTLMRWNDFRTIHPTNLCPA